MKTPLNGWAMWGGVLTALGIGGGNAYFTMTAPEPTSVVAEIRVVQNDIGYLKSAATEVKDDIKRLEASIEELRERMIALETRQ